MVVHNNNNNIVSKLVFYAQSTITVISGRYNDNKFQYRVKNGSNNKQASKQVSVASQKW